MKKYFITGATGAIGAELTALLLKDKNIHLSLLLRAENNQHLQERLVKLKKYWSLPEELTDPNRITACRGDMTLPKMGIQERDYEKIASEATHIIHCAGIVRMNLPLEDARKYSVNSAKNVIDLAKHCQHQGNLEKVEYVSTVGVAGRLLDTLRETWITEERKFHNTYEQAKAEAESLVRQAVDTGLPITVHRPSMVVGDAHSGRIIHFQIFYHICEFLSGQRTLGFLPNLKGARLDIVPVDFVSKALVWSSNQLKTSGTILHLCSGTNALDLMELMHQVREIYISNGVILPRTKIIPLIAFKATLPAIGMIVSAKSKRALKALPIFLEYLEERQLFDNLNTKLLLEQENIILPNSVELIKNITQYYLEKR